MAPDGSDDLSDVAALARLGLKLGFGRRGEYIAEFLDDRRMRRLAGRVEALGNAVEAAGLDLEDLAKRVEANDETAELLERIVEVAARSRYGPKVRYLARCLVNFANGTDDATPDMTFAKVAAVADLEAIHVQLLHRVRSQQQQRAEDSSHYDFVAASKLLVTRRDLASADAGSNDGRMPLSAFQPVMATLTRHGLVEAVTDVEVEVDIHLDISDEIADASPSSSTTTGYRLTELGTEVLNVLEDPNMARADAPPPI